MSRLYDKSLTCALANDMAEVSRMWTLLTTTACQLKNDCANLLHTAQDARTTNHYGVKAQSAQIRNVRIFVWREKSKAGALTWWRCSTLCGKKKLGEKKVGCVVISCSSQRS